MTRFINSKHVFLFVFNKVTCWKTMQSNIASSYRIEHLTVLNIYLFILVNEKPSWNVIFIIWKWKDKFCLTYFLLHEIQFEKVATEIMESASKIVVRILLLLY